MPRVAGRRRPALALAALAACLVACEGSGPGRDAGPAPDGSTDAEAEAGARSDARPADGGADGRTTADAAPDARASDGAPVPDLGPAADAQASDARARDADPTDVAPPDAEAHAGDAAPPRERACFDGVDDDDDGRVDCADPDCRGAGGCFDEREVCDDGVENNGDDHVDCADVTCADACPVPAVAPFSDDELQALVLVRCAPCHIGGGSDGDLRLDPPFRDAVVDVLSTQVPFPRVKPGDRAGSYLYRKVAYTFRDVPGGGGQGMPPLRTLSRAELERLGRWIEGL